MFGGIQSSRHSACIHSPTPGEKPLQRQQAGGRPIDPFSNLRYRLQIAHTSSPHFALVRVCPGKSEDSKKAGKQSGSGGRASVLQSISRAAAIVAATRYTRSSCLFTRSRERESIRPKRWYEKYSLSPRTCRTYSRSLFLLCGDCLLALLGGLSGLGGLAAAGRRGAKLNHGTCRKNAQNSKHGLP